MEAFEVKHRLDLVIRLMDTTTGNAITGKSVQFQKHGERIHFVNKGNGTYILMNSDRSDAQYEIFVDGYEPGTVSVAYGESRKPYQTEDIYLIPTMGKYSLSDVLTMEGTLDGIESLEAIDITSSDRMISSFDKKKQLISYYGGTDLIEKEYALFHWETSDFEVFQVRKVVDKASAVIKKPLEMPYTVKDSIVRIVKGKVLPDNRYLLRIRDDGQKVKYLVRYVVNGMVHFKQVDFRNEEERKLEA